MEIHHPAGLPSTAEPKPAGAKKAETIPAGAAQLQRRKQLAPPATQGTLTARQRPDCGALFWYWATRQDR